MTRKEALAALIAKVEAGAFDTDPSSARAPYFNEFMNIADAALPLGITGLPVLAWRAYNQHSIDAAKALHEAVLPRQGWEAFKTGEYPGMIPGSSRFSFGARVGYGTTYRGDDDCPARAWLLAILRALHAQEAGA